MPLYKLKLRRSVFGASWGQKIKMGFEKSIGFQRNWLYVICAKNALTRKKNWKTGEIWKIYEFLIWSTRLKDCIIALNILRWGFPHIFHVVANIKTRILSTESGQKVNLGLLGELPTFSWPGCKINNFQNIFK